MRVLRSTNHNDVFAGTNLGLRKSTDEGLTWRDCTSPQMQEDIKDIYVSANDEIWVGTRTGLFFSSDAGNTWTQPYSSDTASEVRKIFVDKSGRIFISAQDSTISGNHRSVFVSRDTGLSWTAINNGIIGLSRVNSFFADTSGLVYALAGSGLIDYDILYSWDSLNQRWSYVYDFPPSVLVNNIRSNSKEVFIAATGVFMMASYDAGISWSYAGLYPNNCASLDILSDSMIIAGTTWNGVFVSSDLGNNWEQDTTGLPHNPLVPSLVDPILSICHDVNGRVFVGTRDFGVYRSAQSAMSVEEQSTNGMPPCTISFLQNYPNPFNPFTTISFILEHQEEVVLRLYDVVGREIETLLDDVLAPGRHEVRWNASGLSSGVYFCQVSTRGFSTAKPILLLR